MENITRLFKEVNQPAKGLVIYKKDGLSGCYVEAFDFSVRGVPINFHPLSDREYAGLAELLYATDDQRGFLHMDGIIPESVLVRNDGLNGYAVWYTKPRKAPLLFIEELGIPSGAAYMPPLLWKASRTKLYLHALASERRPSVRTRLYKAPFFNIHDDGQVCMGDVLITIDSQCSLDNFIQQWEAYFFGSYFSHLLGETSPVSGNIVQLWKKLVECGEKFPVKRLLSSKNDIKTFLS